ncbi:MAG: 2-oxoglutarate dehydrogenase complex dihydrolipoyllysine-residue succinyltransferase [Rickettsiaceae bacterium H1]|nr:2-oxoglutarate dehydrogenase complex dihydrolipoyllysine-residue succinyltransferase [Rickettsiaceae bacterium H1]
MVKKVVVPPLGESITEAIIAKIHKKNGDNVTVDEVLFDLETDKVTLEVNSPASGKIATLKAKVGDEVAIGVVLAEIEESEVQKRNKETNDVKLRNKQDSPSAKKLMSENNLNRSEIPATGKDSRITKSDVHHYLAEKDQELETQQKLEISRHKTPSDRVKYIKMSKLRQKIAERLKESQNTAAILTTFNEIDMKSIIDLRTKYKDAFQKKYSIKLGFMSFFVKASITALKDVAEINAEIFGDQIIYKNYYDIGVAVGTEQGLVVPVIRDADNLTLVEIESKISQLGLKAREGKLSLEEIQGGTFTISNGGVYGSLLSTPIINPPQSGILGMHSIQKRPVVIEDKIEIRPMMYTALSYDHRIVDGKGAVTFLVKLKQYIEDPQRLILEI